MPALLATSLFTPGHWPDGPVGSMPTQIGATAVQPPVDPLVIRYDFGYYL
ncbi:hypothetical protein [Neolewinella litorea]|nr:hypothetical protein [Neolewinella litorea]